MIRRSTSLHNLTRINFDISLYSKKITVSEHIRYSNNISVGVFRNFAL